MLIKQKIIPSNEGRGYVLRRIIRRAIRHGHKLGINETFFYKLVSTLAKQNKSAYPELISVQSSVEKILKKEEERFAQTLDIGMDILNNAINETKTKPVENETIAASRLSPIWAESSPLIRD